MSEETVVDRYINVRNLHAWRYCSGEQSYSSGYQILFSDTDKCYVDAMDCLSYRTS